MSECLGRRGRSDLRRNLGGLDCSALQAFLQHVALDYFRLVIIDERPADNELPADARQGSSHREELIARFKRFSIEHVEARLEGDFAAAHPVFRGEDDGPLQQGAINYGTRRLAV